MFRAIPSSIFLALVAISMFAGRLTADDPILVPGDKTDGSSVSFERRQFTVSRQKGKILFDGVEAPRMIVANKSKEIRLIETFDGLDFPSDKQFLHWANKLRGTRTYTYDEVTSVAADGSTFTQPLVFFSNEQRAELDKKWHAWLDKRQSEIDEASRARLAQEQEAKRYQQQAHLQELQAQALSSQIAAAERSAESLAVISGATSLWEVELLPAGYAGVCSSCSPDFSDLFYGTQSTGISFTTNGNSLSSTFGSNYGFGNRSKSIYVRAYGRTSQVASDNALSSNPGYQVGSIRKLAGY